MKIKFYFLCFVLMLMHLQANAKIKKLPLDKIQDMSQCQIRLNSVKEEMLIFLQKNPNFVSATTNKKILGLKNEFNFKCSEKEKGRLGYLIQKENQIIFFDPSLKAIEVLTSTNFAKEVSSVLNLQFKKFTFEQFLSATVLQALKDYTEPSDEEILTYFLEYLQHLKTKSVDKNK